MRKYSDQVFGGMDGREYMNLSQTGGSWWRVDDHRLRRQKAMTEDGKDRICWQNSSHK